MKNILVIDDHWEENLDLDNLFLKKDFRVYTASGLVHGIDIAVRYAPDLIISNLKDEANGYELIKKLHAYGTIGTTPFLYLSSDTSFENQRRVMNFGVDDYIAKPFSPMEILQAVIVRLKKHQRLKEKLMQMCRESLEAENQLPPKDDHILIKIGNRLELLHYKEIVCITALKEYSNIRTFNGRKIIVRKSLKAWLNTLPAKEFLRIHRSTIINIEAIEKIKKIKERSYIVYLKTISTPFDLSQRYSNIMRKTFPT